jgi:hypothetical protein
MNRTALAGLALLLFPALALAKEDRWLHVAVDGDDETVRVNLPITVVKAVAPLIAEHCDGARLEIDDHEFDRAELAQLLEAVRAAEDGEYVTVHEGSDDVRISKKGGFLCIRARESDRQPDQAAGIRDGDREEPGEDVQVRVPLEVVAALLSGDEDTLNLTAALEELAKHETGDLVTVRDDGETVRVWIDRKNQS